MLELSPHSLERAPTVPGTILVSANAHPSERCAGLQQEARSAACRQRGCTAGVARTV